MDSAASQTVALKHICAEKTVKRLAEILFFKADTFSLIAVFSNLALQIAAFYLYILYIYTLNFQT